MATQPTPTKSGFDVWMDRVNRALVDKCMMSAEDLPDCPYRDWYEDDVPPVRAAARAIKYARDL